MSRRLRRSLLAAVTISLVALIVLAVLARVETRQSTAQAAQVPAPLAIGTELQRPPRVPNLPLINAEGRRTSLSSWRGKYVVLAPSMTLCSEVCPITTGALIQLTDLIRRAGLSRKVVVVEATVDPWRDTPARLRAYTKLTGVNFQMLTGTRTEIHRLWKFFGVSYYKVSEGKPATIDWMTHKPLTFDIDHTDALFFISPSGQERIVDGDSMPDTHGHLAPVLRRLLDASGRHNLAHPQLPWTAAEALDDIDFLMGRTIPSKAAPVTSAPTASTARHELADSPRPLKALHAQAGRLIESSAGLTNALRSVKGRYPAVVNVWSSACLPCRAEFPLLAAASARFGKQVAFLGADVDDTSSSARAFLAAHPVSYPSVVTTQYNLRTLAVLEGTPSTIYISRSGKVTSVHAGTYDAEAALDNDVEHYALGVAAGG